MDATKVVPHRIGAFVIDYIIWFVVYVVLVALLGETTSDGAFYSLTVEGAKAAVFFVVIVAFGIGYWVALPGITGWTVGKLALGIRVVREDTMQPPGFGKSFLRGLLWVADAFPYFFFLFLVGLITSLTNDKNQRVGDMVAGTLVVKQQYVGQPLPAAAPGYARPAQFGAPPGGYGAPAPGGFAAPAAPAPAPQPAAAPAGGQPADWYPDPKGEKRLRYWDGTSWTEHTAD